MSNSLIPYSFTPGTKAKAQEAALEIEFTEADIRNMNLQKKMN